MIYTWKITGIKTKTEGSYQKSIVQVYWTKTGTDDEGNTGSFSGVTALSASNLTESYQFIPYDEVSDETILNWIKEIVVDDYERHVNQSILNQMLEKK